MKYFWMIWLAINPITYINEVNILQIEAKKAYALQNYYKSIRYYDKLINELQVEHKGVFMNLAHAYFQLKDADKAAYYYQKVTEVGQDTLQSQAFNQLGYIAMLDQNYADARLYFQKALLKNAQNTQAQYNLELLLKKIKNGSLKMAPQDKKDTKTQNDQQNPEQQSKASPDISAKTPENSQQTMDAQKTTQDREGLLPKKLEEIKLNREKAEAILEALRNQEIQYIQQLSRQKSNKDHPTKQLPRW